MAASSTAVCVGLFTLSASAAWATTQPSTQRVSYSATSASISNPERGFYHYTATHFRGTAAGDAPLDETTLRTWRMQEHITLVLRMYYLDDYTASALPDDLLASVRADFATARRAGVKLIVRFAYSEDSDADAPRDVVLGHIAQLAPALNDNADVVSFLQAGFIGRWGEWYYSQHFDQDASRPWDLSTQNQEDRRAVLDALLAQVKSSIPIQLRYAADLQRLVGTGVAASRVGLHDDCFLASDSDYGTFENDAERSYLATASAHAPVGGETCAVNAPRTDWSSAQKDLSAFHWTYLNADYNRDVLASWGSQGNDEVGRRLGYRLRLIDSTVPRNVTSGAALTVQLAIANDGYAAPTSTRPMYLVWTENSRTIRRKLPIDVRTIAAGTTKRVNVRVQAPSSTGSWSLGLWLPDAASALRTNPAYAVQLADEGTWDPATGVNSLHQTIQVG